MSNQDTLQRFIIENAAIRGELVHLQESFQTIVHQHPYSPLIRRLLGEALVLVTLLTATIKFKGRITLQFQGKGKLKLLLAQCNHQFQLRGLVQSKDIVDAADLLENLKQGILMITIDPEKGGRRYQGIVAWEGESLAQSIEGYFRQSEQLTTRLWVAVDDAQVAGLLLQVMPPEGARPHHGAPITTKTDWEHIMHLTNTLTPGELVSLDNDILLNRLYAQEDVRVFPISPVVFGCTCSVKSGEHAIFLLGRREIEDELNDKQVIIVTCDFCMREFKFDRVDVAKIFRQGDTPPPSSPQVH